MKILPLRFRKTVSWVVVLASVMLGMIVLGIAFQVREFSEHLVVYQVGLAGIAPIVASLVAIRNPRLAWRLDLLATPIVILLGLRLFPLLKAIVIGAAIGALLLPGIFWLVASRTNWPTPLSQRFFFRNIPVAALVISALLCAVFGSLALFSLSLPWCPLSGDCGGNSLLNEDGQPRGIDFTARVLFVPPKFLALRFYDQTLWAIAHVEKRFSEGTTLPTTVILRGFFKTSDQSREYFVEGHRHNCSLLSRFLPIVEPLRCGHTKRVEQAQLELRVLNSAPRPSAIRIIGGVYRGYGDQRSAVVGAKVLIQGLHGNITLTTDNDGIFESTGLPPGEYSIQLLRGTKSTNNSYGKYTYELKGGQIAEASFFSD